MIRACGRFGALGVLTLTSCSLLENLDGLASNGGGDGGIPRTPVQDARAADGTDETQHTDGQVVDGPLKRQLRITNNDSDSLPAGFTVGVPLTALLSKVRADGSDIHVLGPNSERDRVLDLSGTPDAPILWFSLSVPIAAGATSSDYAIAYADPNSAQAPQNPSNVFALFDGFDGTTLSSGWLAFGLPMQAGGTVTLNPQTGDRLSLDSPLFSRNSVFEAVIAFETPKVYNGASVGFETPVGAPKRMYAFFNQSSSGLYGVLSDGQSSESSVASAVDAASHRYRIQRSAIDTRWFIDGHPVGATTLIVDAPLAVKFETGSTGAGGNYSVDWVRVRTPANTEPTVVLDPEEPGR